MLAREDMFQKHVLYHLQKKTSQDGLYPKQVELKWKNQKQIEIKPTTQDLHSESNATQKIKQDHKLILDQAREHSQIN